MSATNAAEIENEENERDAWGKLTEVTKYPNATSGKLRVDMDGTWAAVTRIGSNGETGDKALIHYQTDDGARVVVTNGNQVWEDAAGYAEVAAECDEI